MRTPFNQRATEMGLESQEYKLLYKYSDRYGEVVYRQLTTCGSDDPEVHETDALPVPIIAIYTKPPVVGLGYQYCGYVSEFYQFIGNDVLNQQIRDAIHAVGMPITIENVVLASDLTRMRNEIIIQSSKHVANAGDILPVMIVNNSYNGTRAATVAFGISMQYNRERLVFSFDLGEMRQVHIVNSNTEMSSVVSSYMEVFSGNILNMVTESFQSQLTDDQMLATLDLIEGIGKKKRVEISKLLQQVNPVPEGEEPPLPSAWQMFLAIVRYSSFEPNLNMKKMLENIAESVLVIPARMYGVLERLQSS